MTRTPLVAGNWKMNGTADSAEGLAAPIAAGIASDSGLDVVLCPPHVWLSGVADAMLPGPVRLGAQDVSEHEDGAYTGEVSSSMLREVGCEFVIVGHSERRTLLKESSERVVAKASRAVAGGLTAIVCVGETQAEREQGITERVIEAQLEPLLQAGNGRPLWAHCVIAYEPVWAIGTGLTASPDEAQAVHAFIRDRLAARDRDIAAAVRILYGGSVKPGNAAELFAQRDIDGGLIGGASLVVDDFLAICEAAAATQEDH